METIQNKYITVAYELYVTEEGERQLVEKASAEHPFQFISGLGMTLDAFESELTDLNAGDKFEFTIPCNEAYGAYEEDHVVDLPKNVFEVNGKFDTEQIFEGNVIPLMTADGGRLNGTVVEVSEETVTVDLNHPLAGDDLTFIGEVVTSRPATNEEVQGTLNMMSGEGCGCGCGDGDCGDEGCAEKGCGCH